MRGRGSTIKSIQVDPLSVNSMLSALITLGSALPLADAVVNQGWDPALSPPSASVDDMLKLGGVELSSVIAGSSLVPATLNEGLLSLLNSRCFGEDQKSWRVWFSAKYSNCAVFLQNEFSEDILLQEQQRRASPHRARECAEFLSYMVTSADLSHWACSPTLVCLLGKLMNVFPLRFDCKDKMRCWTILKGINFWRSVVRDFGFAVKSALNGVGGRKSAVLSLRAASARKVLTDVFPSSHRPDSVLWYEHQCESDSFSTCMLMSARPMDWKAIVEKYVSCQAKVREIESQEMCPANFQLATAGSAVDPPHFWLPSDCSEVDEFIRAMLSDAECLHLIPCLLVGGSLFGHRVKTWTCESPALRGCIQGGNFADELVLGDLDPQAQSKEALQTYLRSQVYAFSRGGSVVAGSALQHKSVQRGSTAGEFLFQRLNEDNSEAMKDIRNCVEESFVPTNLPGNSNSADEFLCPFELFLRMRHSELHLRPGATFLSASDSGHSYFWTDHRRVLEGYRPFKANEIPPGPYAMSQFNYLEPTSNIFGDDVDPDLVRSLSLKLEDPEAVKMMTISMADDNPERQRLLGLPDFEKSFHGGANYLPMYSSDEANSMNSDKDLLRKHSTLPFLATLRLCVLNMKDVFALWSFVRSQTGSVYIDSGDQEMHDLLGKIEKANKVDESWMLDKTLYPEDRAMKMQSRRSRVMKTDEPEFEISQEQWGATEAVLKKCHRDVGLAELDTEICSFPGCLFFFSTFRGCVDDSVRQFLLSRSELQVECTKFQSVLTGCTPRLAGRDFEQMVLDCALGTHNAAVELKGQRRHVFAWERFQASLANAGMDVKGPTPNQRQSSKVFMGATQMLYRDVMVDKQCAEDADVLAEFALECSNSMRAVLHLREIESDAAVNVEDFFRQQSVDFSSGDENCAQVMSRIRSWKLRCSDQGSNRRRPLNKWWPLFFKMLSEHQVPQTGFLIYVLLCARGRCPLPPEHQNMLVISPSGPSQPLPPWKFEEFHDLCRNSYGPNRYDDYMECMRSRLKDLPSTPAAISGEECFERCKIFVKRCDAVFSESVKWQKYEVFSADEEAYWMAQKEEYEIAKKNGETSICAFYSSVVKETYYLVLSNVARYSVFEPKQILFTEGLPKRMNHPNDGKASYRMTADLTALFKLEQIVTAEDPLFRWSAADYRTVVHGSLSDLVDLLADRKELSIGEDTKLAGLLYIWYAEEERRLMDAATLSSNMHPSMILCHLLGVQAKFFSMLGWDEKRPTPMELYMQLFSDGDSQVSDRDSQITILFEQMRNIFIELSQVQPSAHVEADVYQLAARRTDFPMALTADDLFDLFNIMNARTSESAFMEVQWLYHLKVNPIFRDTLTYLPMSPLLLVPRVIGPLWKSLSTVTTQEYLIMLKDPHKVEGLKEARFLLRETLPVLALNVKFQDQFSDIVMSLRHFNEFSASTRTLMSLANLPLMKTTLSKAFLVFDSFFTPMMLLNSILRNLAEHETVSLKWVSALCLLTRSFFDTSFVGLAYAALEEGSPESHMKAFDNFMGYFSRVGQVIRFNSQFNDVPGSRIDMSSIPDMHEASLLALASSGQEVQLGAVRTSQILYEMYCALEPFYEMAIPNVVEKLLQSMGAGIPAEDEEAIRHLLLVFFVSQDSWASSKDLIFKKIKKVANKQPPERVGTFIFDKEMKVNALENGASVFPNIWRKFSQVFGEA